MNSKDNHTQLRMAGASILGLVGVALMSRLPQMLPGNVTVPWYRDNYMLTGIVLVIVALLVLIISPTHWKRIWYLIIGFPRRVNVAITWARYGPECIIDDPKVESQILTNPQGVRYRAKIGISVNNKSKPLRIALVSTWMYIQQETEWRVLTVRLSQQGGIPEVELKPWEKASYQVNVSIDCYGKPDDFPNISKKYQWGIQSVNITLPNGGMREFHKGTKSKLKEQKRIGVW